MWSETCGRLSRVSRRWRGGRASDFTNLHFHPHRRHARSRTRPLCPQPADILITTPESIYLLLTSNARETLRSVETVIIDEIHALVPGKRGSHLALSLERLDILRTQLQRIGLSATQRPLEEVARYLGGSPGNIPAGDSRPSRRNVQGVIR